MGCSTDHVQTINGACTACPVGEVPGPNKTDCQACTTDEAEIYNGTCSTCPVGKIQDPNDKAKCKACNTDEAEINSGTCTPCSTGKVPNQAKNACVNTSGRKRIVYYLPWFQWHGNNLHYKLFSL